MNKIKYRKDIDGLRAIAVLPVMLFHAGVNLFPGGYVGVDVFFVISGYLITGVIIRQLEEGTFSFSSFYIARARRILPALFFMLAITTIAAWFLMVPDDLSSYGRSLEFASAFLANIYFKNNVNYFAPAAETMPLLHTWSLAVEEQYYLIFPLLVAAVWRFGKRRLLNILLFAFLISFLASLLGAISFKTSNYYLLPTRAWELLFGGLTFAYKDTFWARRIRTPYVSGGGLVLIFIACCFYDRQTPFPSAYTLLPVIGAALILNEQTETNGRNLLTFAPLVGVGRISYSLYLWHFPMIAFAAITYSAYGLQIGILWPLFFTFLIATISYKWIEQSTRHRTKSLKIFLTVLFLVGACLAALGHILFSHISVVKPLTSSQNNIVHLFDEGKSNVKWEDCSAVIDKPCVGGDISAEKKIILFGDSHAFSIFEALSDELRGKGVQLVLYSDGNCPPLYVSQERLLKEKCFRNNLKIYEKLSSDVGVKAVILVARWAWYIENEPFDNRNGGIGARPSNFLSSHYSSNSSRRSASIKLINDTLNYAERIGAPFFIVDSIPEPGWDIRRKAFYLSEEISDFSNLFSYDQNAYFGRNAEMHHIVDSRKSQSNLSFILTSDVFCGTQNANRCTAWNNGIPLYLDDNHLNKNGARLLASPIRGALSTSGVLN